MPRLIVGVRCRTSETWAEYMQRSTWRSEELGQIHHSLDGELDGHAGVDFGDVEVKVVPGYLQVSRGATQSSQSKKRRQPPTPRGTLNPFNCFHSIPWLIGLLWVRAVTCGALLCVVLLLRARRWKEILIKEQYREQFLAASSMQEDQELRPLNDPDKLSRVQSAWLRSLLRWTPTSASRSARPSRGLPDTRTRGLGGLHSDIDGSLDIEDIWQHWGAPSRCQQTPHAPIHFRARVQLRWPQALLAPQRHRGQDLGLGHAESAALHQASPSTRWPRCITNTGYRPEGLRWRRSLDLFWKLSTGRLHDRFPAPGRRYGGSEI